MRGNTEGLPIAPHVNAGVAARGVIETDAELFSLARAPTVVPPLSTHCKHVNYVVNRHTAVKEN